RARQADAGRIDASDRFSVGRSKYARRANQITMQMPAGARADSGSTSPTREYEASQNPVIVPTRVTGQDLLTSELDMIHTPARTCPPSRTGQAMSCGTSLIARMPARTSKATHP